MKNQGFSTKKHICVFVFGCRGEPQTLYLTAFSKDFPYQKSAFFGPSWAQTRKRSSGARAVTILEVTLLNPPDGSKPVKMSSRWLQVAPSWLQIVHITHTPKHTHAKKVCPSQTSKITEVIVVGHVYSIKRVQRSLLDCTHPAPSGHRKHNETRGNHCIIQRNNPN